MDKGALQESFLRSLCFFSDASAQSEVDEGVTELPARGGQFRTFTPVLGADLRDQPALLTSPDMDVAMFAQPIGRLQRHVLWIQSGVESDDDGGAPLIYDDPGTARKNHGDQRDE